ncbi:hypothetical protein A3F65_02670 [Candidatus Saccharibacteria bacterium RIFCSPHIGHO2_12_FULL_47_16b]|nr:MAG: hypothetical protein A3F65_02670 [Candidatus Saccharibacteria bacterium RIFCSPHIGHO2_12_FULL_47_16b]OGL39873.1 MAG: hypothetical protein A3J32_00895 [Candidatus Saccharibacteria bacterium RIFCSPLOWO2_02_FULL_46_7]
MSKQVKVQVPMDKDVRDRLAERATKLGFDSLQAYIRVWAKAETEGRNLNFGQDDWGEPSDAAAKRLNRWAEEARQGKNVSGPFNTVEELMEDLLQ